MRATQVLYCRNGGDGNMTTDEADGPKKDSQRNEGQDDQRDKPKRAKRRRKDAAAPQDSRQPWWRRHRGRRLTGRRKSPEG